MTTSPNVAPHLSALLRAVDLFPRSETHTAYVITAPLAFDPQSLAGQTIALNDTPVVIRAVHQELSGVGTGEQSFTVLADRVR